jgi:hypothetical protein
LWLAIRGGARSGSVYSRELGAHHYVDSDVTNPAKALQTLGGAAVVLATASAGKAAADTMKGLRSGGEVIVLGDEALNGIAGTPKPLAAFVFSRDQKVIDRFIGELSYGSGAVNQVNIHLFIASMPFGGTGKSGIGQYYGKHGLDALTHAKSMLISPPDSAIGHLFPPYADAKNEELKQWLDY